MIKRAYDMVVRRMYDVITGSDAKSKELFVLQNFPVNMLADKESNPSEDKVFDMHFAINEKTGILQLTELLPNEASTER